MSSPFEAANRYWSEHRPQVIWGMLIGLTCLAFLVGAWFAYDLLASPPEPDLQSAPAVEVAEFIVHARGWRKMSVPKRKQWLGELVQARAEGPKREALVRAFHRLSRPEKREFVDGFIEVVKPEIVADARTFAKTPRRQRNKFLQSKLGAYNGLVGGLRGGGASQDLAAPFGAALPDKSSDWTSMVVQKTSPTERADLKPFIDQLTEYAKSVRQQAKADEAAGKSTN